MTVLTVISDPNHGGFYKLKASCALQNLNLKAIVCDQTEYEKKNHRTKDELIKNYLEELNEEETILFTDGYDTLLMADEQEIADKFKKANTSLLFSAEADCWPDTNLKNLFPDTNGSIYKYLNSGGYIGKAGLIKKLLSEDISDVESNFDWSNQYSWTIRYLRNKDLIRLDTQCNIFSTFSNECIQNSLPEEKRNDEGYTIAFYNWFHTNYQITGGRIYNKITGTWPCNAHFNGQTSDFMTIYPDCLEMLYSQIPGSSKLNIQHVSAFN